MHPKQKSSEETRVKLLESTHEYHYHNSSFQGDFQVLRVSLVMFYFFIDGAKHIKQLFQIAVDAWRMDVTNKNKCEYVTTI